MMAVGKSPLVPRLCSLHVLGYQQGFQEEVSKKKKKITSLIPFCHTYYAGVQNKGKKKYDMHCCMLIESLLSYLDFGQCPHVEAMMAHLLPRYLRFSVVCTLY